MMVLDTSVLIEALMGPRQALPKVRLRFNRVHRIRLPSLVLFEWWRGPRTPREL